MPSPRRHCNDVIKPQPHALAWGVLIASHILRALARHKFKMSKKLFILLLKCKFSVMFLLV
jgi:hypothetical protein